MRNKIISDENLMKPPIKFLFLFLVAGFLLRVYHLDFQCLWTEEQYTLGMASLPSINIIIKSMMGDFTPPVFYLIEHIAFLQGLSLRVWPLICGMTTILVMYCVGDTFKDKLTGLYCAGFTSILFPFIYYSQFGRSYTQVILFFSLALLFYISIRQGDKSYESVVLFSSFGILAIWSHLFAAIPIALLIASLVISKIPHTKNIIASVIVFCSPLLLIVGNAFNTRMAGTGSNDFGMSTLTIMQISDRELLGDGFFIFYVLLSYGLWHEWRAGKTKMLNVLACIAGITILAGLALSLVMPVFPRYYLVVSVIFILIASVSCRNLTKALPATEQVVVMLAVMLVVLCFEYNSFMVHYFVQQYVC